MRIAFFNSEGLYGVITYFTEQLSLALRRLGMECQIYNVFNGELAEFIANLDNPPDFTCSISGKSCFNHDFFSRQTGIPHIAYCMDAPIYYYKLIENPHTLLTFVDRSIFEFLKEKKKNTFFLSLGTDRALSEFKQVEPCYDVLMIGACFDYESIRKQWQEQYPEHLASLMEDAIELLFTKDPLSFPQAIMRIVAQKEIIVEESDFFKMCRDLENYMRGKDRLELLKSIKNAHVTIFGPHRFGPKNWSDYVGIFPNVTLIQGEVSYTNTFELIRKSKIYLNSCPSINDGAHERVFNGLLLGSLVLSNETRYYREYFQDEESILFYRPGNWKEVDDKIGHYLSNESARQEIVQRGKEVVLNHHTWDHRAQELLGIMNVSKQNL